MLFGFWRTVCLVFGGQHRSTFVQTENPSLQANTYSDGLNHTTTVQGFMACSQVQLSLRSETIENCCHKVAVKDGCKLARSFMKKIHFLKQKKIDSFDFIWNYNYLLKFELNKELLFCVHLSNWRPTVEEELAFSFSPSLDLLNFINSFIDRCIYIFIVSVMHLLKS